MSISSSIRDMINKTNNAAKNTANKAQSTIKGGGSSSNQGGSSSGSSKPSSGGSSSGGSSSSSSSSSKGSSSSGSSYRPSRGGSSSSSSSSSDRAYREYQEALAAQKAAAEAAQKAKIDSAVSRLEGQRPSIYQNAEAAAKQAYINKMLAQRDMAQQMAATGLSGGLTDSALLAMNSDYENSHNAILQNQNSALNELSTNINQIKAGGDLSLAELESQYQANLAQQAAQEMARRQEKQDQMDLLAYQAQMQGSPSLEEGYAGASANPSTGWNDETEGDWGGNLSNKGILLRQALRMEYGRNSGLLGKKNAQDFVIKRVQTAYQSGQISYADAQAILRDYGLSVR